MKCKLENADVLKEENSSHVKRPFSVFYTASFSACNSVRFSNPRYIACWRAPPVTHEILRLLKSLLIKIVVECELR